MCIFETEIETETKKMVETESFADLCPNGKRKLTDSFDCFRYNNLNSQRVSLPLKEEI